LKTLFSLRALLPLCASAFAFSAAAAAAPPLVGKVIVRPAVTVAGRAIRLRDVADNVSGPLANVTLGAAALPGRACILSAGEIRLRVRAAGFDPAVLALPSSVVVSTEAAPSLAGNALVQAATEAVKKALPWPAGDVTMEPSSVPALPVFGANGGLLLIAAGAPVFRTSRTAVVPVTLTASASGEARTVSVALRIRVETLAVVAVRPVARHAVVGADDVALTKVELIGDGKAFANVADVVGKRTNRSLIAGRAVAASDVEEAPVVGANTRVTVRVASGIVEVTTSGTTCEEGCMGQTIRVRLAGENGGTSRTVRARVDSADTVIIENGEGETQ